MTNSNTNCRTCGRAPCKQTQICQADCTLWGLLNGPRISTLKRSLHRYRACRSISLRSRTVITPEVPTSISASASAITAIDVESERTSCERYFQSRQIADGNKRHLGCSVACQRKAYVLEMRNSRELVQSCLGSADRKCHHGKSNSALLRRLRASSSRSRLRRSPCQPPSPV